MHRPNRAAEEEAAAHRPNRAAAEEAAVRCKIHRAEEAAAHKCLRGTKVGANLRAPPDNPRPRRTSEYNHCHPWEARRTHNPLHRAGNALRIHRRFRKAEAEAACADVVLSNHFDPAIDRPIPRTRHADRSNSRKQRQTAWNRLRTSKK